jgi:putative hydrolase of the HAD superfamily
MSPLVLFDLDNTLVDRAATYRRWAERFAIDRGLGPDAVDWLCDADEDGFARRRDVFTDARRHFGLAETADELVAAYWNDYFAFYEPDPATNSALMRLRSSGWRIGIVTNGPSTQHEKIGRADLLPLVDACCVSEEIGASKPDRRIFDEAFARCGHCDDEARPGWMVGDAPVHDIGGGRDAGLRTIWMTRGRHWEIAEYSPDFQVSSVAEAV